jgi:hypothetical protein
MKTACHPYILYLCVIFGAVALRMFAVVRVRSTLATLITRPTGSPRARPAPTPRSTCCCCHASAATPHVEFDSCFVKTLKPEFDVCQVENSNALAFRHPLA